MGRRPRTTGRPRRKRLSENKPQAGTEAAGKRAPTRVILLGTAGGPALRPGRCSPGAAVVVDGTVYLVDCGYGIGRQLVAANLGVTGTRAVFITHHHSDHNADLGNLLVLSWATGLRENVAVVGPPPLRMLLALGLRYHARDIALRIHDEGRQDPRPLFEGREFADSGIVYRDARVTVEALRVHHPPLTHAYAYRFTTRDRSVVFSGDTAYFEPLAAFAHGADLLVHEVLLPAALDRLLARVPNATLLREHIIASHTAAEEVGRLAAAAGVPRLALTHFVPSYDPDLTDEDWREPVGRHYDGEILVAQDLAEV